MVERNQDDIPASGQVLSVVGEQFLPGTRGISASMQPHHHGSLLVVVDGRRPDIEAQAVFSLDTVVPGKHERLFIVGPAGTSSLRRHGPMLTRTPNSVPGFWLRGRHEAIRTFRRVAVRYSLEGTDAFTKVSNNFPSGCRDNRAVVVRHDRGI